VKAVGGICGIGVSQAALFLLRVQRAQIDRAR
jgi:hypothetical protein